MGLSQVENEDYSVFNWLSSISSPTVMLGQLKSNVGTSLADRLELLKQNLSSSKVSTEELHTCKVEKKWSKRDSFLPVTATKYICTNKIGRRECELLKESYNVDSIHTS